MNAPSTTCPGCGKPAAGRFCSHCGTALTADAAPSLWTVQTIAPWAALGVALLALFIAFAALLKQGGGEPVSPPFASAERAPPGQPPDLSSMTPREAADRLFNRIVAAAERDDAAEAARFMPMAIAAYSQLGTLDVDARYHLGLLYMIADDIKDARAQLDAIRQSAPNHLLGIMLAHEIAERSGDKAGAAQAYETFLAAYDAEIAAGRPEYQHHASSIERFRTAAQARAAGKK